MSRIAVYAGSFDPITKGHLSVLQRGTKLFDSVILLISNNLAKKHLFPVEERVALAKKALGEMGLSGTVGVDSFQNELLITAARRLNATVLLRGLRAVSDFDSEFQMAQANHSLDPNMETVFVMTQDDYFFVSSSMVREIAHYGGDVSKFVPQCVLEPLRNKFGFVTATFGESK